MDEFTMALAKKISAARRATGKTQKVLADELGIHENTIQYFETGRHRISALDLSRVAKCLSVSVASLIGDEEAKASHEEAMRTIWDAATCVTLSYEEVVLIYCRQRGFINDGAEYLGEVPKSAA